MFFRDLLCEFLGPILLAVTNLLAPLAGSEFYFDVVFRIAGFCPLEPR